jgi:hypothetical protein
MKSILVFIDGTICDGRQRYHRLGHEDFHKREWILKDKPVPGSSECLAKLANKFQIVYIGARPSNAHQDTLEWLKNHGFPPGEVYLGETQPERLEIVRQIKIKYEFVAGIGDRWDDNDLHEELGCHSIILKEHEGDWEHVIERIYSRQNKDIIQRNKAFVAGKVEGLARVCPLLLNKLGVSLWDAYHESVREMAESSRETRRREDLESFKKHDLDPENLIDMAEWYRILDEENCETEPLYGLQERQVVETTSTRYVEKVTRCFLAELWKEHNLTEIGYQIHCRTDTAWWDCPSWNPSIRFEQPQTLMQGADSCIFIQYLPKNGNEIQ